MKTAVTSLETFVSRDSPPVPPGPLVRLEGVLIGLLALRLVALAHAEDWPMLGRGSTRNPVSQEYSTTAVGERLYLLRSNVVCLDITSGEIMWGAAGRFPGERAAVTYADGLLYVQRARGTVELLELTNNGTRLKSSLSIPGHEPAQGVTSPVVIGGRLYLRNSDRLHCYSLSAASRTAPDQALNTVLDLPPGPASMPQVIADHSSPKTGVNRAPDAVFLPTPQSIVEEMLRIAQVRSTDHVVDLGSGDGRFVIAAAKVYGAHSVGYEIDSRLVDQSRRAIRQAGLETLARIEHEDIFTIDLQSSDVVTVFLYPRLMERLIPQFEKLKPGSRIISHQFDMPGVKPDQEWLIPCDEDGEKHRILLWITPLRRK